MKKASPVLKVCSALALTLLGASLSAPELKAAEPADANPSAREWGAFIQVPDVKNPAQAAVWRLRFYFARTRADGVSLYRGTAEMLDGATGFGYSEAYAQKGPAGGLVQLQVQGLNLALKLCPSAAPLGFELCEAEQVQWSKGYPLGAGPGQGSLTLDVERAQPLTIGLDVQLFGLSPLERSARFPKLARVQDLVKVRGQLEWDPCDGCEHGDLIFLKATTDQVRQTGRYTPEKLDISVLAREWGSFYERDCPGSFKPLLKSLLSTGVQLTYSGRLTSESENLWSGHFWTATEDAEARVTLDYAGKVRLVDYLAALPEGGSFAREMGTGLEGGWSEVLIYRTERFESRLNLESGEWVQREI